MSMTRFGDKTARTPIFKLESHKLMQSFPFVEIGGKKIVQGDNVVIKSDGSIRAFESTDSLDAIIGVATTDSATPAYQASKGFGNIRVTVAMRGFILLNAIAGSAGVTAGFVKPSGSRDATGDYSTYDQSLSDDNPLASNYIALNAASAGELVRVLVK